MTGLRVLLPCAAVFAIPVWLLIIRAGFAIAQTANSNAGLEGGQDHLVDAIFATPNHKTPFPTGQRICYSARPRAANPRPAIHIECLGSGSVQLQCAVSELRRQPDTGGSPLVRLGWASQLFDSPIRLSGAASMETERFVNAPGAAIDYIRTSARAQYLNPEDDQDYSPFLSYVPWLDFDPTFANNVATRQDLALGLNKVFNFDGAFNRIPTSSNSSSEAVWSFGFGVGGQRRFRSPAPQSYAFFFSPSASYVISEEWNASLSVPITRRWFEMFNDVSQRNLTLEPTAVLEYVIPSGWLGGANAARMLGTPAIDFVAGVERNWSNLSQATYTQWRVGVVLKTGWRF